MNNKNIEQYQHIWNTVKKVPKGAVATYGQIADVAGLSRRARLVGYALKQLPKHSTVPWHRVINAKGQLSFPKASSQYKVQQNKLIEEGIVFQNNTINLKHYQWQQDLDALLWGSEK